jgi:hypothetical protein
LQARNNEVRQSGKIRQKRRFSEPALQEANGDKGVAFQAYDSNFHSLFQNAPACGA